MRIDRWLYYCRFFKSRSLATSAVAGGHAKINGERATPGTKLKIGDRIDLVRDRLPYAPQVLRFPSRRGPSTEARECFSEDDQTIARRESLVAALRQDRLSMPRTEGRPDKHTRRKLMARNRND